LDYMIIWSQLKRTPNCI